MANWYGVVRTNYFRVKDVAAFEAAFANYDVEVIEDSEGRVGLVGSSEGYWPDVVVDYENGPTDIDFDITEAVAEHLLDNEVAVFVGSGAEKARYVTGYATAINAAGERLGISIDDIYGLVKQQWGVEPTAAEY